jgi:hypothetical protein
LRHRATLLRDDHLPQDAVHVALTYCSLTITPLPRRFESWGCRRWLMFVQPASSSFQRTY